MLSNVGSGASVVTTPSGMSILTVSTGAAAAPASTLSARKAPFWKVTKQGKDQQFGGASSYENGILTLVQDQNNNAMVGNVVWTDASHFAFKVLGGGTTDPGLSFSKTP